MSQFTKDVMNFGPAPTLAREIPAAAVNLVFSALVLLVVYALNGSAEPTFYLLAAVLLAYCLGRPLLVALRGNRAPERHRDES